MAATKIKFVSPFGTARYPHLSKPDTVGKYANNKFKTKLVLKADSPEAVAYMKKCDDAFNTFHPKPSKIVIHRAYTVDEETNEAVFVFSTSYAPALFDGNKKSLNGKAVGIGGGSVLRIMGNFIEFDKGISAQMNQVQVTSLESFGECGFDEVEGSVDADDYGTSGPSSEAMDDSDDTDSSLDI